MSVHNWMKVNLLLMLSSLGVITSLSVGSATPARAENRQIAFTLSSQSNQTFAALTQQAESLAKNLVEQAFAQSPSVTEVSVTIMGEHNGQEVPLLFSTVSRSNWQKEPRIQPWTHYASNSATLLGFLKPKVVSQYVVKPVFAQVAASKSDVEPNFYQ